MRGFLIGMTLFISLDSIAMDPVISSPVTHHILYRWVPDADPIKKQEFLMLFLSLEDQLPGIQKVIVKPLLKSKEDYSLLVVLHFESEQSLESYQYHALHERINLLAKVLTEDYTYFQY